MKCRPRTTCLFDFRFVLMFFTTGSDFYHKILWLKLKLS